MKIIINADDYGRDHVVNTAIVEAFRRGYITNTTIMCNMPHFNEAVELAKQHGFSDKVGLHLNFFDGIPLSEAIQNEPLFFRNGKMTSYNIFHNSSYLRRFILPTHTQSALREEAAAQISKYLEAGFTEMHLDSHGHSHTIISVLGTIAPLIRDSHFKTIRKSLNLYRNRSFLVKAYKALCNWLIGKQCKTTTYFTSASEFIEVMESGFVNKDATCEIMVHPNFDGNKLVNAGSTDFEILFRYLDEKNLISFVDI